MKKYHIALTTTAQKHLKKLDLAVCSRILDKLEFFEQSSNPLQYAKKLKNKEFGQYRFRVGDYRVLFDLKDDKEIVVLFVLAIGHRRDIYL